MAEAMAAEDTKREAWLAARRQHITATDVGKIMGLSPFGGPTSVWLDKKGLSAPFTESERMRWGRRLEEAILAGYAETKGVEVWLADPHDLVVCEAHPILAASLDGTVVPDGAPVDAKNIGRYDPSKWGDDGTAQIPDQYALQLAVQMLVTNAPYADLAVLFSGARLQTYRVHRNEEIEATIISTATEWWERYIIEGVQPPPDGTEAYSDHLSKKLRQQSERLVSATDEATEWAAILRDTDAKLKVLATVKEEAQQYLKEAIADAAGIEGPGFRATWKTAASTASADYMAMAMFLASEQGLQGEALQTIIDRFTTTKPGSRRFLSKWTDQ